MRLYSIAHSGGRPVRSVVMTGLFAALTAVGAMASLPLPLTPVPFSLQVLFVLLSGIVLGGKLGAVSQVTYVAMGVVGIPVFAGGRTGPSVLVGPTGGYVLGFVVAPLVVSAMAGRSGSNDTWSGARVLGGTLLGVAVIHALGAAQLGLVANLTPSQAVCLGVLPFIAGDVAKALIAAWLAHHLRRRGFVLE